MNAELLIVEADGAYLPLGFKGLYTAMTFFP
jgi:hypothetical protein